MSLRVIECHFALSSVASHCRVSLRIVEFRSVKKNQKKKMTILRHFKNIANATMAFLGDSATDRLALSSVALRCRVSLRIAAMSLLIVVCRP
jgi:3-deoxy-D-manno-octulosonate 8-phosphate phosphatase KdsC-like HAD superfamily phosphatase